LSFAEGVAAVRLGQKWGYIDAAGKFVIRPRFDEAWSFRGGLAWMRAGDKADYIDRRGRFVWKPSK
jgi:hypothetical protein